MHNLNTYKHLILISILFVASCQEKAAPPKELIRPVRYQPVIEQPANPTQIFAGTARAGVESRLSFRVSGRIIDINVNVGDRVSSGAVIATLDDRDYRLRAQEAEASLKRQQANARNAAAILVRTRGLYENNNASRNELDAARAQAEANQAAVASITNQLELARRQLSYTQLKSPSNCAVATLNAEINENITVGQTVALLACGGEAEVAVNIPETFIAGINQGDQVSVSFSAIDNKTYNAIVTEVGVATTNLGTTFPVTVKLRQSENNIRSGMAAEVQFTSKTDKKRARFIVPLSAVLEDSQGRYVFIAEPKANENNLASVKRIPIEVGELTANGLEINKGLEAQQLLITAGVTRIKPGQTVKLLNNQ